MQITATPAATVTKPFSALWTNADAASATRAEAQIVETASDFGCETSNLVVGPAVFESMPPKGNVSGQLTGPSGAVDAALAAIGELRLGW